MSKNIDSKTRRQIADFLPSAISKTLQSYEGFILSEEVGDAKEFTAHHNACKVAISHLELLLKLASWAEIPTSEGDQYLSHILNEAQKRVSEHHAQEN